jgi:hypothetical protein
VMDGGEPGDSEIDGSMSGGGEAGTAGESGVVRQWIDGGEPGDGKLGGGVSGGGEAGTAGESGVARQWRGERGSSYITSGPRSSSTSLRLFLSRLAGGVRLMAAKGVAVTEVVSLRLRACHQSVEQRRRAMTAADVAEARLHWWWRRLDCAWHGGGSVCAFSRLKQRTWRKLSERT